jgi:sugar phosphate isomerase/epimerase
MSLSITTALSNKGSLEDKIKAIAYAGFTHVCIDEYLTENLLHCGKKRIDNFIELINRYNLGVDWIHAPFANIRLYTEDIKVRTKSLSKILSTITLAGILKARSVIIHAFDNIKHVPYYIQKSLQRLKTTLDILLETGRKAGVMIALENLTKRFMNDITLALIDKIPDLGVCFDTGHAEISNSWDDFLSRGILPKIIALHIHDNHGYYDEHLIPGDGIIDFYRYIKILYEGGYGGIWGIECIQNIGKYNGTSEEIAEKAFTHMEYMLSFQADMAPMAR